MKVTVSNPGSTVVKLTITHSNLKLSVPEFRFDLFETIGHIKVCCLQSGHYIILGNL